MSEDNAPAKATPDDTAFERRERLLQRCACC